MLRICNLLVCDYMPSSLPCGLCYTCVVRRCHMREELLYSCIPVSLILLRARLYFIQHFVQLCISCINSRNTYAAQYMYILSVSYLYTGCNKHDIVLRLALIWIQLRFSFISFYTLGYGVSSSNA